ncbi:PREDICTED: coiled-coil domain-containing protein 113 isoform X2 [Miniopterus natalensis]|uniref:coiled-coil domain-containing protein 113 isoform X2 n=1 Tax=Miniopterus natalensis TaxID=291302 RepID=UPI0007A724F2|nr:PREDICTED: coiled-coil domain-containing protein 113 isoform X2 [Miniopterus natalensis]
MSDDDTETPASSDLPAVEESELPVIQLCSLVEELSYGNSALKIETEMFEKYYNKLESREQRPLQLSEIQKSVTEFAQAIIEEAEIRWAEVRKAMQEFERDILKTISKKKGSILATQKVMKYLEDMNHQRDHMKDKLCLKNVSLKVLRKQMLLQLRQKEEVGEALHDVDFQQLKIENAQFLETIETRNQELIQLKLASGTTLQVLNSYKTRLHRAMEMSINLEKEILLRNELLEKIERETLQVEEDRARAEALNTKLRKQLAEFRAPPVMLYVKEKILNGDLEKTIRMWERKVEIAEMSLKGYRKDWNKMKTTHEQLLENLPPGK